MTITSVSDQVQAALYSAYGGGQVSTISGATDEYQEIMELARTELLSDMTASFTGDEMNREWRDIVLKKRFAGPTIGAPTPRSMQLFDVCGYDMDRFHDFIRSPGFSEIFDVATFYALTKDEGELLKFAMRFLRQVLFGEHSIPLKQGARERRIAERKSVWEERKKQEIERFRERDDLHDDE